MNKNFLIIVGVIVVLIGGYLFLSNRPTTAPSTNIPAPTTETETTTPTGEVMIEEETVVTYTNDGFTPQSVTVKSGSTVKFMNESDNSMWVASAPHPAHTDLPGFDQLTSVDNGEEYGFTFEKAGTWKYHNHVNPSDFGSVVVE